MILGGALLMNLFPAKIKTKNRYSSKRKEASGVPTSYGSKPG
jgi:hypothetical protein